ncbi:Polygalacturonase QRT3 [Camellia lanceoleosa]|uniref:Polygalacturonase QRT3 n=1 Tax=Camellia lanceoleosa TaxID=1840588 RepID=A0ACC0GKL3_9ERIC|nr:Polygalacturonase QRT3 [Camellia lanceoleosa]
MLVQGGSFRASDTFPSDRHLIELWAPNSQPLTNSEGYFDQKSPIYYEDITFRDILFDSSYRGGGIFVIDSARIRIHDYFFIHFTSEGILVQKGHETFISTCFLGQCSTVGGDKRERAFSGTAIDLASNDNAVTDVVIFSAATGVILRGQTNLLTGVYCYNKATVFGGVGILVKSAQNRIHNCYMDYNAILIEDPFQVQVANGFFLGDGNIVLKSIKGFSLHAMTNVSSNVVVVESDRAMIGVVSMVVDQNNMVGERNFLM